MFLSTEMYWALASLPSSTRSWSWLPSRPSEPRSSKCMAAVCRSNKRSTHCCLTPLLQTQCERADGWWGGEEERALPVWRKRRADLPANCTPPSTPPSHISSCLPWFLTSFFSTNPPQRRAAFLSWLVRGESRGVSSRDFFFVTSICALTFNNCVGSISLVLDQCVRINYILSAAGWGPSEAVTSKLQEGRRCTTLQTRGLCTNAQRNIHILGRISLYHDNDSLKKMRNHRSWELFNWPWIKWNSPQNSHSWSSEIIMSLYVTADLTSDGKRNISED